MIAENIFNDKIYFKKIFLGIAIALFWVMIYAIFKWSISFNAIGLLIEEFLLLFMIIIFPYFIYEIFYNVFVFSLINIFFNKKIKPKISFKNKVYLNFNFIKILFHCYLLNANKRKNCY